MPEPPPVPREPTVSRPPPPGRKFPCPSCGARLDYDPAAAGLKCPYCGYAEAVPDDPTAEVVERDYTEYLDKQAGPRVTLEGRSTEVRCPGCGAVVLLEDNVATDRCPFCLTHLESAPKSAATMIPPESLLPFRVDLRAARDRFAAWLGGLWFAPSELTKVAALGRLSGVYLPHWTYDAMTYTHYRGERGDDYQDTEYYTEMKPDGSTESKSRTVTRTRWWSASGEVRHFFDDVLVSGTAGLPDALLDGLRPWDLENLDPFQAAFLSGFKTERYAVGLADGFGRAKEIISPEIDRLICKDIGGDHQRIHARNTRYSGVTFKHLLLPVWVAAYRYHDRTFQVLVNGRSGKVAGKRPYSWAKIAGVVLFVAVAVTLAVLAVAWLRH